MVFNQILFYLKTVVKLLRSKHFLVGSQVWYVSSSAVNKNLMSTWSNWAWKRIKWQMQVFCKCNSSHSIKVVWQETDNGNWVSISVCTTCFTHTHGWEMWVVDFIYLQMFPFYFFMGLSRFIPSSTAAKPMLSAQTLPASPSPTMEPRSLHEEVR